MNPRLLPIFCFAHNNGHNQPRRSESRGKPLGVEINSPSAGPNSPSLCLAVVGVRQRGLIFGGRAKPSLQRAHTGLCVGQRGGTMGPIARRNLGARSGGEAAGMRLVAFGRANMLWHTKIAGSCASFSLGCLMFVFTTRPKKKKFKDFRSPSARPNTVQFPFLDIWTSLCEQQRHDNLTERDTAYLTFCLQPATKAIRFSFLLKPALR